MEMFTELDKVLSEIVLGMFPLTPLFVSSSFEATITSFPGSFKTIVPFPKAIPGTEKILTTFSLSVWLKIGLVLLLTVALFWCASNGHYRSVRHETHT